MTTDNRQPRKTRESGARKKVWVPPSQLDTPPPQPGYEYRWVRLQVGDEADNTNVYSRTRQNYEFVTAEEFPDFEADVVRDGRHKGVIRSGDLILMKVPTEIAEQRREYYDNLSKRQMAAVNQELYQNDSKVMPIINESRSSVTQGTNTKVEFED